MLLAFSMALVALGPPAFAHPFDSNWYGQQLDVRLQDELLEVHYRVEVPSRVAVGWLAEEARRRPEEDLALLEQEVIAEELRDLESGLRLEVDGELSSWSRGEVPEETGTGDDRFVRFELLLRRELDAGPHALRLYNGNHPDERTLHHYELQVDDSVILDACSLFEVEEGALTRDRTGEWRGEEDLRELTLSLRPRTALGRKLYGLLHLPEGDGGTAGWRPGAAVLMGASAGSRLGLPGLDLDELLPLGLIVVVLILGPLGLMAVLLRRRRAAGPEPT